MVVNVPMQEREREFMLRLLYDYKEKRLVPVRQNADMTAYYNTEDLDRCIRAIVAINEAERAFRRSNR